MRTTGRRPSVVYSDGILTIEHRPSGRGYVLTGEVNDFTYEALSAALDLLDGDGDVHLDVSGLDYCDAPGLGTMVALTDRVDPGDRVIISGVTHALYRLASIVGWHAIPNLVVSPRPAQDV